MEILSNIVSLIVIIGIIVFFHEFGHFAAAKLFRMRVERFSLGFPPRAFGRQIGETDYCVSWLPIGGYVKISGMIDESMDTEHLSKPPEPWEFRSKPIWQRSIVISAGVVMNIVLAILVFWGLNFFNGSELYETTTVGFVAENSAAQRAGLQPGDRVTGVDGRNVAYWQDIESAISGSQSAEISIAVERSGVPTTVAITSDMIAQSGGRLGLAPPDVYALIGTVDAAKPAGKIGLKVGDVLIAVNGAPVHVPDDATRIIKSSPNTPVTLVWLRGTDTLTSLVTPNEKGLIGIGIERRYNGPVVKKSLDIVESFVAGVKALYNVTALTIANLWQVVTGQVSFRDSIGGPVRIAEMASQAARAGVSTFLSLMAILSISLAIINILPFPALDGGHLAFLTYEAIFKREVPKKIQMALQQTGFILLMAFMAFVLYNDIFR